MSVGNIFNTQGEAIQNQIILSSKARHYRRTVDLFTFSYYSAKLNPTPFFFAVVLLIERNYCQAHDRKPFSCWLGAMSNQTKKILNPPHILRNAIYVSGLNQPLEEVAEILDAQDKPYHALALRNAAIICQMYSEVCINQTAVIDGNKKD